MNRWLRQVVDKCSTLLRSSPAGWIAAGALLLFAVSRGTWPAFAQAPNAQAANFPIRALSYHWEQYIYTDQPVQFSVTPQGQVAVAFGKANILDGYRSVQINYIVIYDGQTGAPIAGYNFNGGAQNGGLKQITRPYGN